MDLQPHELRALGPGLHGRLGQKKKVDAASDSMGSKKGGKGTKPPARTMGLWLFDWTPSQDPVATGGLLPFFIPFLGGRGRASEKRKTIQAHREINAHPCILRSAASRNPPTHVPIKLAMSMNHTLPAEMADSQERAGRSGSTRFPTPVAIQHGCVAIWELIKRSSEHEMSIGWKPLKRVDMSHSGEVSHSHLGARNIDQSPFGNGCLDFNCLENSGFKPTRS